MIGLDDTICAPATVAGTGVIAVIRVSGPEALRIADEVISFRSGAAQSLEGYSLHYASVPGIDDVMVSIFRAPHSYTGEDAVEISCHSSSYIAGEILTRLVKAGARMAEPGEFTRRAFLNGKMDLAQAEAVADLVASDSAASHAVALHQLKGGYSSRLRSLRDELVNITSLMELELDFSEEDVEFANRSQLEMLLDESIGHIEKLASSFRDGNALKNGVPVAIVGAPNSGKSTLLNALVGEERALVSDVPGTTRDTIEETMVMDGIRYRFIDTAGLRKRAGKVEKMGIERSLEKLAAADIVLAVLDAAVPVKECVDAAAGIISRMDMGRQSLILIRNKVDIFDSFTPEDFPVKDRSYGIFDLKYPAFGSYDTDPATLGRMIAEEAGARLSGGTGSSGKAGLPGRTGNGQLYGAEGESLECWKVLDISARTGEGLDELRKRISSLRKGTGEGEIVTNLRHYEALLCARDSLYSVRCGLTSGLATVLLAADLRDAIRHLGTITGSEILPDEILGAIFSRFCIGK